jgi:hypothetical protein
VQAFFYITPLKPRICISYYIRLPEVVELFVRPGLGGLVFLSASAILHRVERKDILKKSNSIVLAALLILLTAIPVMMAQDSYKFHVSRTMSVAGTEIKAGFYDVRYEVNKSEATVQFYAHGKVSVEVKGKVVENEKPADNNALAIGKNGSGSEEIKELFFRDKTMSIIFG